MNHPNESSLIKVNEATEADLQQLPGIGPMRARRIVSYRLEVSPIRNTFDLATATGMSLGQADKLGVMVSWDRGIRRGAVGVLPFFLTVLATLWLATMGLIQAVEAGLTASGTFLGAGISVFLAGLLLVTADITTTAIRQEYRETTGYGKAGMILSLIGLGTILMACLADAFFAAPVVGSDFSAAMVFVSGGSIIAVMLYGPPVSLRLLTRQGGIESLVRGRLAFDTGYPLFALPALLLLETETGTLIEEWFSAWTAILLSVGATDLLRLRSPFMASLSDLDQGRFRFMTRDRVPQPMRRWLAICSGLIALGLGLLIMVMLTFRYAASV